MIVNLQTSQRFLSSSSVGCTAAAGGRQCLPRPSGGARAAELEAAPAPLQRRGQVLGHPPLCQVRAASSLHQPQLQSPQRPLVHPGHGGRLVLGQQEGDSEGDQDLG